MVNLKDRVENINHNNEVDSMEKLDDVKKDNNDADSSKIKRIINKTKDNIISSKNKIKNTITEQQMIEILDNLYSKSINGIPKVSLPIEDLVDDYIKKNKDIQSAAKSLIHNSTIKCGTSGFLTGFGGFATMIATLPANITSVIYVQLRMCCALAKMGGYDIHSDQVQTLVYACLTGSALSDVLKQAGIKFGNKFGVAMIKKIPGKTLNAINRKVGFRFVTKFGQKGIINLGKVVPVLGGVIGGGIDVASTRVIGNNAYSIFIKGELSKLDKIENEIIEEAEYEEIDDIDCKSLKNAVEYNVILEEKNIK